MINKTTSLRRRQLDKLLIKYKDAPRFRLGYIREIRDALGMGSAQLGTRLGISQAGAAKLEHSEIEETISLKTLSRAAEALNCKLIYALVPKTSLDETVRTQSQLKVVAQAERIFRSMGLELQSTDQNERDRLINEMVEELIRKGGHELWK